MGAYMKPLYRLIQQLVRLPGELRLERETKERVRRYKQCIQEGRDPRQDPYLNPQCEDK